MQRIVGITISNSQGLWLGFSLRSTPQHMWLMGVYIVWVQKVCIRQDNLAKQNVSRVSRRKALLASYSRNIAVSIYPDSLHSSQVQGTCIISQDTQSRATHENSSVLNLLDFSHSFSLTQPLQLNSTINTGYKKLNKITIKFGTELKPTKQIVVNYNFRISPFGYSVTKPLKQTLNLNVSLGTVAKLNHT